ncbi:MAG: ATP-binding cassette domain-containing protein, partial [Chloroflexi bacterium]|nr:ATP-binding cassette domain-containing protein [Chloroflexota bacterium]
MDREVQVIDDVSLSIRKNEVFGIAGESGCGKST